MASRKEPPPEAAEAAKKRRSASAKKAVSARWLKARSDPASNAAGVPDGASMRAARQAVLDGIADAIDRLEESRTLLDLDESDAEPIDQLQLTRAEWEFMKGTILAALFAPRPRPELPTDTAPASPDRIVVMALRAEAGVDLYHPDDADVEGRKLKTEKRANGTLLKVLGWEE